MSSSLSGYGGICGGTVELRNATPLAAASNVNTLMTATYWEIGRRVADTGQQCKRYTGQGVWSIQSPSSNKALPIHTIQSNHSSPRSGRRMLGIDELTGRLSACPRSPYRPTTAAVDSG